MQNLSSGELSFSQTKNKGQLWQKKNANVMTAISTTAVDAAYVAKTATSKIRG